MQKRKNKTKLKQIFTILIVIIFTCLIYINDNYNKTENINTNRNLISIDEIPEYSDEAYIEINNNIPNFKESDYTTEAFEDYSELDDYGRCGVAYANICKEIMPKKGEKRGDISNVKPTGWKQKKYNGEYLFNVTGMLSFENKVAEYIKENENNHVLYRVTPVFEGENLLASGVEIEAYSVEDNGKGICFNVYVYNIQPGVNINYLTGESTKN